MQRHFQLRPSRYFAAILLVAHGLTAGALFPLSLPMWAKIALALLVAFSLGYQLWRAAWLSAPSSSVALTIEGGQVVLTTRGGKQSSGRLLRDSAVTPYLTVLNVLPQGARFAHNVVILPDSLDAESFRQLRVWLRWGMNARSGIKRVEP